MSTYIALALVFALVAIVAYFITKKPAEEKPNEFKVIAGAKKATRPGVVAKVYTGPKVHIYFGSQTGTAEGFAEQLCEEFKERNFNAQTIDLDAFDEEDFLTQENVVFCVATYGEGEPTDSSRTFYKWISDRSLDSNLLPNTKFMVFGLGDRQYEHYQAIGILFDNRMEEIGATRMFRRGEGDNDGSIDEDFAAWRAEMWPAVTSLFGVSDIEQVRKQRQFKYAITWANQTESFPRTRSSNSLDNQKVFKATVTRNDELHTALSDRSCRHIELDISETNLRYETGDHVAISQHNDSAQVEALLDVFKVDPEMKFSLRAPDGTSPFPCPTTPRDALTKYLEINSIKKVILIDLSDLATDAGEQEKLRFFSSKEGKEKYDEYALKGMRNMLDLLRDFPSVKISFENFLEICPRMQPRYYSIASSSLVFPKSIHVTASVDHQKLPEGREFNGVCTTYLQRLPVGAIVTVSVRSSNFKLPRDAGVSSIMIGPGTGIAPLRGFIQQLTHVQSQGLKLGKNILFFGCQNRQKDFLYESELLEAGRTGVLFQSHIAFSREQAHKVYVQDKLAEVKDEVLEILKSGGHLYICGAVSMAKQVRATLTAAAQVKYNWSSQQADQWLQNMQKEKRFCQDVWG